MENQEGIAQEQNHVNGSGALAPVVDATGDVISRMVERDITLPLTDEKLAELAVKAADLDKEKSDLEREKKKLVSELNSQISKKDAEISKILEGIRKGEVTDFRMVKEVRDYNSASVKTFIGDSFDELVEERAMQGDELQKDMFLRGDKPTDSGDDAFEADLRRQKAEFMGEEREQDNQPKQETQPVSPEADLKQVMREETNRHTKHSATDGPMA